MEKREVILKLGDKKVYLEMPNISDAWRLNASFKKHFDYDTVKEVESEIKSLKDKKSETALIPKKAYNLSLKLDTCPDYMDECLRIVKKYLIKTDSMTPSDDLRERLAEEVIESPWFRENLGKVKVILFLEVALVFFNDHTLMLPILTQMMSKK